MIVVLKLVSHSETRQLPVETLKIHPQTTMEGDTVQKENANDRSVCYNILLHTYIAPKQFLH